MKWPWTRKRRGKFQTEHPLLAKEHALVCQMCIDVSLASEYIYVEGFGPGVCHICQDITNSGCLTKLHHKEHEEKEKEVDH